MLTRRQKWLLALADPEGPRLDRAPARLAAGELAGLWDLADRHGVLPAVAENFRQAAAAYGLARLVRGAAAGADLDALLAPAQSAILNRVGLTLLLRSQLARIAPLLAGRGVPVAVLKGADFADRLYPRAVLRPFTDIDLLVSPERRDDVLSALAELGYAPADGGGMKYADGYAETTWRRPSGPGGSVEVHWNLVNSPTLRRGVSVCFEDLRWEADGSGQGANGLGRPAGLLRPAPEAMMLIACVHAAASHALDRLQMLCDIGQIARGRAGEIDVAWLAGAVERTGSSLAVAASLDLAGRLLDERACLDLKDRLGVKTFRFFSMVLSPGVVLRGHAYLDSFRRQYFRKRLKQRGDHTSNSPPTLPSEPTAATPTQGRP